MTPTMLATLSPTHIILVALVVVLLFGAQKIPQLMRSLGSGMNEFKKGLKEGEEAARPEATPPPVPAETTPKAE
ncbi:MAG TPA: twin-arginine translocase TatA/TatE family subunit [Planctomycetota bacterium]|jgi:sec-independent protein translocase protein TatA|nr:twin-arginine translocase TatA/TatE family subunit [Planctomycetota bacterium]